jgi:hypothetical protein
MNDVLLIKIIVIMIHNFFKFVPYKLPEIYYSVDSIYSTV